MSSPLPARLQAIRDTLEAATPGPWRVETSPYDLPTIWGADNVGGFDNNMAQVDNLPDATFIASAPVTVAKLLAAVEAMVGLHKAEKRWMPYDGADVSYATREEAIEACEDLDIGIAATVLVPFDLCAHCKVIEDSPCEGECTMEAGYRESLYPCATIRALTDALGEK